MKTKKFLILAVLVVITTMFFTGCSYDITEEYKESQKVAEDFLSIKGYEAPKGYTVRYLGYSDNQFSINVGRSEIVFNISENGPEMTTISDSSIFSTVTISSTTVDEIKEVAYEFLNNAGYRIPEGYSIKYLGENKKQLEVKKVEGETKIIVTFNILEEGLEIENVEWYQMDEIQHIVMTVIIVIFVIIIIIVLF